MAEIQQMAGYAAHLYANTPTESKGKAVTEIAIFKLKSSYEHDHAAVAAEFESRIAANCKPGAPHAKGIRRIGWGFSVDDPASFVWMLDWDKIEDHWDFWLAPGFPPVISAINELFEPGRPLVRHFDFGGLGSLGVKLQFVRIMVWDDGDEGKREGKTPALGNGEGVDSREGYAVDLDESTWWCSMLGYESQDEAMSARVNPGKEAVSHIYRLKYLG